MNINKEMCGSNWLLPLKIENIVMLTGHADKVGQHVLEVGGLAAARPPYEGDGLVLLSRQQVLVCRVTHRVDVRRHVLHLALLSKGSREFDKAVINESSRKFTLNICLIFSE